MNSVILQLWEESNQNDGVFSNGCSIHLTEGDRLKFISDIYSNRDNSDIPNEYDSIVGNGIEVFVTDSIYNLVNDSKSVKISEVEFQNLIKFEDIIYNIEMI
jgi:hypothetical protein